MLRLTRTALGLFWGIWFGGIVGVFMFATALFASLTREYATAATGVLFPTFERYALVVAALALAACFAWRALSRARAATVAFGFLAVATVALVLSAAVVTPEILKLRVAGQTKTPAFGRAHAQSGVLYVVQTIMLLGAGVSFLTARAEGSVGVMTNDQAGMPKQ